MFEEMPASEKRDDYITAISAMLLRLYMKMDDEVHAKAEAEHLEELLKKYKKNSYLWYFARKAIILQSELRCDVYHGIVRFCIQ